MIMHWCNYIYIYIYCINNLTLKKKLANILLVKQYKDKYKSLKSGWKKAKQNIFKNEDMMYSSHGW